METLFIYLIKANAALVVFCLVYMALLRKDTFIRLKRHYFLAAIGFSLLYPFFTIDGLGGLIKFPEKEYRMETSVSFEEPLMTVMLDEPEKHPAPFPWLKLVFLTAVAGTVSLTVRLCWQLDSIIRIRRKSRKILLLGAEVWSLQENITPFSFFGWIFLNPSTHSEAELRQILVHEQTHVRQRHSLDIMLAEWLCVFFWWNPAAWLMKREMAINLEYLADSGVLRTGVNNKEYQYHLLRLTYHETAVQIVNNFNVSQLKQRIMMMNKSKSPTKKLARYLTILPVAFLLITLNSCLNREKKSEENAATPPDTTVSQLETPAAQPPDSLDEPFTVVEFQPEYPGGQTAMMKFLFDNIKYPTIAQEKGVQGRVICNFVVEKDGSISDIQVVRGVDPSLDKEAVRVIEAMPKWTSGKQNGEVVRVRFTLPVIFRLAKGSPSPPPPIPASVKESKSNETFDVVDKQPEYAGGQSVMMKFLSDNIKYPVSAQENGVQGRVICNFVVEKDGSITDVNVVKGVNDDLDKESLRVIKLMPKWKPGIHKGEIVRTRFTLPVVYRLQK